MKASVKRKWLKALRSRQYKRTEGCLRESDQGKVLGYCCLGVLCDIHSKETKTNWNDDLYLKVLGSLPKKVMDWAGLEETNPIVKYKKADVSLADLNDGFKLKFSKIADVIERAL